MLDEYVQGVARGGLVGPGRFEIATNNRKAHHVRVCPNRALKSSLRSWRIPGGSRSGERCVALRACANSTQIAHQSPHQTLSGSATETSRAASDRLSTAHEIPWLAAAWDTTNWTEPPEQTLTSTEPAALDSWD